MFGNLKFLHMTDFFSTDILVIFVTNMRYGTSHWKMTPLPAGTKGAQATIQGKSSHLDFIRIDILIDCIVVTSIIVANFSTSISSELLIVTINVVENLSTWISPELAFWSSMFNHLLRRVAPRRRSSERGKRTAFGKRQREKSEMSS